MDPFEENKISKLKRIFKSINEAGLLPNHTKINYNEVLSNMYYLNLLIADTYNIMSNARASEREQAHELSTLTNPEGGRIFTMREAEMIINVYKPQIINLIDLIKRRRLAYLARAQKAHVYRGGGTLGSLGNLGNLADIDNEDAMKIFDWVFHPLYKLEHDTEYGYLIEAPLDILGVFIETLDGILDLISPLLGDILGAVLDVASMIPGVGVATGAVGAVYSFLELPLEWLIGNIGDMFGIFVNIQRKQWGLAYLNAMQIIPFLSIFVEVLINYLVKINKYLRRMNSPLNDLKNTIALSTSATLNILKNPDILLNIDTIYESIILPNKSKIPFLKKIPDEKMQPLRHLFDVIGDLENNSPILLKCLMRNKLTRADFDSLESVIQTVDTISQCTRGE
tara:strand:+ start:5147 stop:6334 length:1188 start_codon:yes stop_codon:yes gene_type:complete